MSETSVTKTFKVDGALYDADSMTIQVVRNDTGATVVAAGTAMTRTALGTYRHSWTDPADGLVYTYTISAVIFEGTANEETYTTSGTVSGGTSDAQNLMDLVPDVQRVAAAATPLAMEVLRMAAHRFCYESGAWKIRVTATTVASQSEYTITHPWDAFVRRVEKVTIDDIEQDFTFDADETFELDVTPTQSGKTIEIDIVLVPMPSCENVSQFLITRWGKALVDGALGELARLPGKWSGQTLSVYERQFQHWLGVAKRENIAKRKRGALVVKPRLWC